MSDPAPHRGRRAAERLAGGLLLAAAVAPFWSARFLPLLDLPQHLGLAVAVARAGDPASPFAPYLAIDPWPVPYWAFDGLMWLLQQLFSPEVSAKLVLSGYAAGLPLAAAFLLRSLGRDPRWAVLAVPLVFSTNLFYGFLPFLVGTPLLLLALGLLDRHLAAERPGPGGAVLLAAAAVAVYLSHPQPFLLLGFAALLLLGLHWRGPGWAVRRALPLLPALGLFAAWVARAFLAPHPALQRPGYSWYGRPWQLGASWEPFGERVGRGMEHLFGSFSDRSDRWLGWALLALLTLAAAAARAGPAQAGADPSLRQRLRRRRGEVLCLAFLLLWLCLPYSVRGQWYLAPRYLVFAALLGPAFLRAPADGPRRWLLAAGAALALLVCGNAASKVRAFQPEMAGLDEVLSRAEQGGRLAGLLFLHRIEDGAVREIEPGPVRHPGLDPDQPRPAEQRISTLHHAPAWYQVWRGGDLGMSFAGLPSNPVRYRPGMQAPFPLEWRPEDFDFEAMGRFYDWYLVRGAPPGFAAALARHAAPVARSGRWELWRRAGPAPGGGASGAQAPSRSR
ncbi:MAG TPA: hypothetical protein VEP68_04750 [Anaeromyxobacteraceae bacterium]|nr:hypothetical protein [Anaeromyxobacteraceae bacterium]